MTIPSKGTRKIIVEGIEYRWLVSPSEEGDLEIIIECLEYPKQTMLAWVKGGNIISPLLVRNAILSARLKGWQSEQHDRENWFGIGEIILRGNDTIDSLLLRSYQQQDYKLVLDLYELTLTG